MEASTHNNCSFSAPRSPESCKIPNTDNLAGLEGTILYQNIVIILLIFFTYDGDHEIEMARHCE